MGRVLSHRRRLNSMSVPAKPGLLAGIAIILYLLSAGSPLSRAQVSPNGDFDALAQRAREALDAGRLPDAVDSYRRALALRPAWAEGAFNLGGALYELKRYPEAIQALERATALGPKVGLGWALLGLSEAEAGQPQPALIHLVKAEEFGLDNNLELESKVRVQAARLLLRGSDYDEAYLQLTPLAKRVESVPGLVETMGLCVLAVRQDHGSLSERQRAAAELAGTAVWAGLNNRPEESASAYKELFEQFGDDPGVHYAHGSFLINTDIAAAAAEFEKEIKANPAHWPSLLLLASLQGKQGQAAEAIQTLERALKIVPARVQGICHLELGRVQFKSGNVDAALQELLIAERALPGSADVHFQLSQVYRRAGRKLEAQKELDEFERLKAQQGTLFVPTDK